MCVNPVNGDVAYLAGCFVVVYGPTQNKQLAHLQSRTMRPFQSVTFSKDGQYLAAGENAFQKPEVIIWEVKYDPEGKQTTYTALKYLKGHKYGVEALRFSPDNRFLVSLGDADDRGLFLWNWREEKKISQNKLTRPVLSVAFSENQDFFVTAGYKLLKFWQMDEKGDPILITKGNKTTWGNREANLEKVRFKVFVGVYIYQELIYTITADGYVYLFSKEPEMLKWMNIRVERAFGCQVSDGKLYCACADGIIRIFECTTLKHILTMPKPPPLGGSNLTGSTSSKVKVEVT
jgi:mitogen-activated protein kinase binding protein 1